MTDWGRFACGRGSEEALVFLLPLGMMGNNMTLAMALKEQIKVFKLNSKRMRKIYTVVASKCVQMLPLSHILMGDLRGSFDDGST